MDLRCHIHRYSAIGLRGLNQCFPTYGHMAKMGHGKLQVDHRNFIIFTGPPCNIYGPQVIEWSIELLLTTSP